jgi:Rieske Fe-S protein
MGCTVAEVRDGTIHCGCHGSQFSIADGSVRGGPAQQPLSPLSVEVVGDTLVLR